MSTNQLSLIERKKLQWAKEREELANLGSTFSHNNNRNAPFEDRSNYGSRLLMIPRHLSLDNFPKEPRRSSLPPLYKNQYSSNNYDYQKTVRKEDRGGETSGYGSDNNASPEYRLPPTNIHNQWYQQQQQQQGGYESSTSTRDDRPKWGDKGVGLSKFTWQSKEEQCDNKNEPPNWVKRGLEADGAIVVANSSSPSVSPEDRQHQQSEEQERPSTGSSYSVPKSYIRGQNIRLDAAEIAERERKRQIALAHQDAIRQQLQERERKRQEERERRIKEEKEEDLRIEREQEYEKQKKLQEAQAQQEKLEKEMKRKQAIQEALELAEKEAQLEKMRLKMKKKNSDIDRNIAENVKEVEKVNEQIEDGKLMNNRTQLNNCREPEITTKNNRISTEITNNLTQISTEKKSASPTSSDMPNSDKSLTSIQTSPTHRIPDQFNHMIQPSLSDSLQNFQYALLIPAAAAQLPIAIPVKFQTQSTEELRTENRLLTPTQYRNRIRKCNSSTQTDDSYINDSSCSSAIVTAETSKEKCLCEKLTNLELNEENKKIFRRSRSENANERPKWGVNRPPTRYLKQSEKDPLYLRRKLRQKRDVLANKSCDEKNSSDESQTGMTTRRPRKKEFSDKRLSRSRWNNLDATELEQLNTINNRQIGYQRELIPLESNKDQLYYKCCCKCRCRPRHHSSCNGVDILKISDVEFPNLGHYQSEANGDSFPELSGVDHDDGNRLNVLNKLKSLRTGLAVEQEKWEEYGANSQQSTKRHRSSNHL